MIRCPRNTSMNKHFADMMRPQLGASRVTMDGIGSFVFLADLDLGNADVELTLIARALEVASEVIAHRFVFTDAGAFALCFGPCFRRDKNKSMCL